MENVFALTGGPGVQRAAKANKNRPPRYPTPNLRVESYKVGEYVAVWTAEGARLVVKLGAEGGVAREHEVEGACLARGRGLAGVR